MPDVLALATDVLRIGWINVLLSVDNAIMIALACRGLPDRQRRLGMSIGAFGAIAMRIAFTVIVAQLLTVPCLRIAGGLCVAYIAAVLPFQGDQQPRVDAKRTLLGAIGAIVVADTMLSLDNSLAIAAAAGNSKPLIIFGLALSLPLIIFGARFLSSLLARLPILVWLGAVVLGWAGGELIAADPIWVIIDLPAPSDIWAGASCAAIVLAAAVMLSKRNTRARAKANFQVAPVPTRN